MLIFTNISNSKVTVIIRSKANFYLLLHVIILKIFTYFDDYFNLIGFLYSPLQSLLYIQKYSVISIDFTRLQRSSQHKNILSSSDF